MVAVEWEGITMVSITGNLEVGRICLEGQNFLLVKVDAEGGPMMYENDRGAAEIQYSLERKTRC